VLSAKAAKERASTIESLRRDAAMARSSASAAARPSRHGCDAKQPHRHQVVASTLDTTDHHDTAPAGRTRKVENSLPWAKQAISMMWRASGSDPLETAMKAAVLTFAHHVLVRQHGEIVVNISRATFLASRKTPLLHRHPPSPAHHAA